MIQWASAKVKVDQLVATLGILIPGGMNHLGHVVEPGTTKDKIVVLRSFVLDQSKTGLRPAYAIRAGGIEGVAAPIPDVVPHPVSFSVCAGQNSPVGYGSIFLPRPFRGEYRIARILLKRMVAPLYLDLLVDQIVIDKQLPGTLQITQGSLRLGLGATAQQQAEKSHQDRSEWGVRSVSVTPSIFYQSLCRAYPKESALSESAN